MIEENPEAGERVLERIRADGPLSSLDFESERGSTTDWFGVPTNTVRALLEAYTSTGVLGLARREGKRRYYDLLERLLPAKLLRQDVPMVEQMRHKLHSRFRVHGLLGVGGGGDIFGGIGPAKPDPRFPGHPGRTALREELVESGDIVPVKVEGVSGKRFVLREEVALLEAPPEPQASVAFLPPFDPLVWDRSLLGSLFGFDYVWELFHPPAKRRWGWYVLPILFGDRLVGRIEPRIDRAGGRVEVIGLWWEDGFDPRRAEGSWMRCAMRSARTSGSRARAPRVGAAPGEEQADLRGLSRSRPRRPRHRIASVRTRSTARARELATERETDGRDDDAHVLRRLAGLVADQVPAAVVDDSLSCRHHVRRAAPGRRRGSTSTGPASR